MAGGANGGSDLPKFHVALERSAIVGKGELAAGLEVGTRILKVRPIVAAPAAAATTAPAAAPVETAEAKAAREAAEAAKVAEAARHAAMAKLSPEERKALGL